MRRASRGRFRCAATELASSPEMGSAGIRIIRGRRLAAMARAVALEMAWVAGRVAAADQADQADQADPAGRAAAEGRALRAVDLAEAGVVEAGAVILGEAAAAGAAGVVGQEPGKRASGTE